MCISEVSVEHVCCVYSVAGHVHVYADLHVRLSKKTLALTSPLQLQFNVGLRCTH